MHGPPAGGTYASLVRRQLQSGSANEGKENDGRGNSKDQNGAPADDKAMSRQSTGAIVDEVSSLEIQAESLKLT